MLAWMIKNIPKYPETERHTHVLRAFSGLRKVNCFWSKGTLSHSWNQNKVAHLTLSYKGTISWNKCHFLTFHHLVQLKLCFCTKVWIKFSLQRCLSWCHPTKGAAFFCQQRVCWPGGAESRLSAGLQLQPFSQSGVTSCQTTLSRRRTTSSERGKLQRKICSNCRDLFHPLPFSSWEIFWEMEQGFIG